MTERVEIGNAILYRADCREVLPTLRPVDCVITDPPYSSATQDGARTRNDDKHGGDILVPFCISYEDLKQIFGLCVPRRWIVASVDWRHGVMLDRDPPDGLRFVRAGCWVKSNGAPQFTGDRPAPGWEFVACMHNSTNKMKWNGGGKRAVWQTSVARQNGHPTPKPECLMTEWIADFSDYGETILDPFAGSGTTGVAALEMGRKFIGIERDHRYFEIMCERLRRVVDAPPLFPFACDTAGKDTANFQGDLLPLPSEIIERG